MKGGKATAKLRSFRYTSLRPRPVNFLAVWPSLFVVSMGLMAVLPTLGLYVQDRFGLEGDALRTCTGWAYAAAPLTAATIGPLWGVLGDRWGRKRMVLRAAFAIAVATALMPLADSPGWLIALRVLQGAFAGIVAPAMVLGTADVPPERQGLVIGRLQIALALGLLAGPAVGGEVAFHFGRASVFYLTSGLSLLAAVPVWIFVKEDRAALQPTVDGPPRTFVHGMVADLGALLCNRVFVLLLGFVFLLRFGQHMVEPFVAFWIQELGPLAWIAGLVDDPELALERTVAFAFVVLAAGQLLFATTWGRLADRIGPLRCLASLGVGLSIVFVLTGWAADIATFAVLRCCAAVFMAGGMTLAYAAVARRVAPSRKSLAFSLVQSGMQFGLSLGPVAGGWLASDAGIPGLYFIGGGCLAVAGVGMMALRLVSAPNANEIADPADELVGREENP